MQKHTIVLYVILLTFDILVSLCMPSLLIVLFICMLLQLAVSLLPSGRFSLTDLYTIVLEISGFLKNTMKNNSTDMFCSLKVIPI